MIDEINEFSTEAIALQNRPPARLARAVTITLCLFALLAVAYAVFARMDVVITATGRVVPSGKAVVVQSFESATVRSVLARDGQRVKAGDVLVMLSPIHSAPGKTVALSSTAANRPAATTAAEPPRALLDSRLLESLTKLATLDAEVTRRRSERDAIAGVIDQLIASQVLVQKRHAMRDDLARTGHLTQANLIESKLELINLQKEISIQQNRLREAESALNAALQSRTQADAEYKARFPDGLVSVAPKPRARKTGPGNAPSSPVILVAPIDGVVLWLSPLTAGDTVSATQNLVVVVPENAPLAVEALVFNKDIGHLRLRQPAVVKIETFDYTRYGHIEGVVQWIGADAIPDPKLGPVYASRVTLKAFETPNIVNGRRGQLTAGMNVTVDVRVTERRMIEYFLAPLLRYKEESLRER